MNNVERVQFDPQTSPNTQVRVRVLGTSVVQGPQPYSLVATGRLVWHPCEVEFPGGIVPESRYIDESVELTQNDEPGENFFKEIYKRLEIPLSFEEAMMILASALVVVSLCMCWCCLRKQQEHSSNAEGANDRQIMVVSHGDGRHAYR